MRLRFPLLAKSIAAAVAAGLLGASALAQVVPAAPPEGPDAQPDSAPAPRVGSRTLGSLAEAREVENAPHERLERAAYLGVATSPAQPAMRQQLHLPRGVGLVVEFIDRGSPADAAGLQRYDIIEKLDDQLLVNPQQLAVLVRLREPGEPVRLNIVREGKPLSIDVKLTEKQVPPLEELRLGNAEPVGPGAPVLGENDWPTLPVAPGRRIGQSTFALPQSDGALHVAWTDGSADLTLSGEGAHRFLIFRDKAGHVLFRGPVDTAEQRATMPKSVSDRLESLPEPFALPAVEPTSRPADSEKVPATQPGARKIQAGDRMRITVDDLTGPGTETVKTIQADRDGTIQLPYLDAPVAAVGLSTAQLESAVVKAYKDANIVQMAQVSVQIVQDGGH
jgi:hypothetical protein